MANYIQSLQSENGELKEKLAKTEESIRELISYYLSPKFHGVDSDFAHVSTDVLPRLRDILNNQI